MNLIELKPFLISNWEQSEKYLWNTGNGKCGYTRGVKEVSSTICTLFTLYLDCTIQAVRTYGDDGFLGDCHITLSHHV